MGLWHHSLSFYLTSAILFTSSGCSILATRPVQEMSDASAAIKAAREVQADILAPDLFRTSSELFFKAKREYKFKNFRRAEDYANRSRIYAEQAEFDSIRNGATRNESKSGDPYAEIPAPEKAEAPSKVSEDAYPYPTPTPTPADLTGKPQEAAPSLPSGPPSTTK